MSDPVEVYYRGRRLSVSGGLLCHNRPFGTVPGGPEGIGDISPFGHFAISGENPGVGPGSSLLVFARDLGVAFAARVRVAGDRMEFYRTGPLRRVGALPDPAGVVSSAPVARGEDNANG